jgi:phosphoribosyl 1,2-cyclic phosphodiesterase
MRIKLLPSNCVEPARLQPLTTFLVNDKLAIDAGSLGLALQLEQQRQIHHVIITHAHSDHTASLPIFIAEVFPFLQRPVVVHGTSHVIDSVRRHIFNDSIWPDFTKIHLTNTTEPSLVYDEIVPGLPFEVEGLRITPVETNHVVPSIGLAVEDDPVAVIFTSDTYCTDEVWQLANRLEKLRAIFVDVSYPNELESLAAVSKHLTPQALDQELNKLMRPIPVYAVHLKPQFRSQVIDQLFRLNRENVSVAEIGREYAW